VPLSNVSRFQAHRDRSHKAAYLKLPLLKKVDQWKYCIDGHGGLTKDKWNGVYFQPSAEEITEANRIKASSKR
jgi:hypothetical protein